MSEKVLCIECKHFTRQFAHSKGFTAGYCLKEPFDTASMNNDEMSVVCGHDSQIIVGGNFGCVNGENEQNQSLLKKASPVKKLATQAGSNE